jgi:hypothetical protein
MQGGTEKEQGTRVRDEQQDKPTNPFHSQSSSLQVSGLESLPSRTRHLTPPPPRRPHPSIPYHTSGRSSPIVLSRHLRPALRSPPRLCLIPHPHWRETHPAWAHEVRTLAPLPSSRAAAASRVADSRSALLLDSRQQSSRRALRRTHAHVRVANPAAEGSGLALLHHR